MTVNIDIQVTGDHWFNRLEFIEKLENADPNEIIVLNVNTEGPSLESIGVRSIVDTWLKKYNRPPDTIFINNWANGAEQVPYKKLHQNNFSHFFKFSQKYWPNDAIPGDYKSKLFGLFLGRRTIARNSILYYVANNWSDHFLLSAMKNKNPNPWPHNKEGAVNLEIMNEWISPEDHSKVFDWISTCNIPSIDNRSVQDQYSVVEQSSAECNRSLLTHYNQFNIELVCESYTIGDTFFPTEKTVRPIAAAKPILLYGPKNFLTRLRSLGFKTYSQCWDEGYDQLEGPARWRAIQSNINQLINLSEPQLNNLLDDAKSVAVYNRQHLAELIKR
jgi:hypothetical protein